MSSIAETRTVATPVSQVAVELPLGDTVRCALVHDFLTAEECKALVAAMNDRGFISASADYPPSYRDNDRLVTDEPALANRLFQRLLHCMSQVPRLDTVLAESGWNLVGINERLRFCRYTAGTQFRAHQDGVHHGPNSQSRLTFMVYLNDGAFSGGETVFFRDRSTAMSGLTPTLRLKPRTGSLIIFDHSLWHAGALVESGRKYIMRSDLMYQPQHLAQQASGPFQPSHDGYVWVLASLGEHGFASAGRDATIRLWDREGRHRGTLKGHTQSILGLVVSAPGELVSHARDRTIRRWSLTTGQSTVVGTSDSAVLSGALLDHHHLVTGAADGSVTLCNMATGAAHTHRAHACWVWAIVPLGDGGFATASEDGTIKLWRPEHRHCTQQIELGRPLRTLANWIGADGSVTLAAGDIDGVVHLLANSPELARLQRFTAHNGAVRRIRFEDRHLLLTCGEDGLVKRIDLRSRQCSVIGSHDSFATDVLPNGSARWVSCGYDSRILMHGDNT